MSVMMDESDAGGGRMSAIDDELEYDMGYAEWVREHDKKLEAELWSTQAGGSYDLFRGYERQVNEYQGQLVNWLSFDEYNNSNGSMADIIDSMIMKEIEEDNQRNMEKRAYLNWLRKCK